ncbi:MAG TPA: M48 family metallopeptidase [Pyrinomonadaceae bacterium]|nr:M48 family metallopeptidase [Pyrinomonadaceae bacterium]
MKQYRFGRQLAVAFSLWAVLLLPFSAIAQTTVKMPKNKYKVQDDVKIGSDASRQVEQQFPILHDRPTQAYVERVGERLVAAIPPQFQQPAFDYKFEVVNARDINAFALPGGPMYVNRGMIEAAKNEGEMAGVMAHEISHVALRHATAQQTKLNSPLNQILGIGAILGGAILGGGTGAELGQMIVAGSFLRYSRDYETQADILGARIMADAGYDPRDLANMFKTIAGEGGGRGPEWLSSHPDPGNRYQKINQEANYLNVSRNPIKVTQEFSRTQERLRAMPRAKSMAEIEKDVKSGNTTSPTANGRYTNNVPYPSTRYRTYRSGNWIQMNVPTNWEEFSGQSDVTFSPQGAYGDQGITHGAMVGLAKTRGGSFDQATRDYVEGLVQSNSYLRQQGGFTRTTVAGRQSYMTTLSGRSPVTGRNETVTVYTVPMRSGDLLYIAAVAPSDDAYRYNSAFRTMIRSVRLNDQ